MCTGVTLASLQSCGIWLVSIDSSKMNDHGRSKSRQFRRTFTCLRCGPQAGLRLLSLFLSSVGKISRLYGAKYLHWFQQSVESAVCLAHL